MLYAGANYHPHDWPKERWIQDIQSMKEASFNVVRLGHLCWDSFEPSEGNFTFEWFDDVMDLFAEANIEVVLDIATRPAPTWLHIKYPAIDITDRNGIRLHAQTRYMEDVGHPAFQEFAYRFAERLVNRYKNHPAILAFGLCNELGAGHVSYSKEAEVRFGTWLQNKYQTIEKLNTAWSSQRWSRKLSSFQDVVLPVSGAINGAPERLLDMWKFYSDETSNYMFGLSQLVKRVAPNVAESTNHWAENPMLGFDYLKAYQDIIDIPGVGFYPGTNPEDQKALMGACFVMDHRIGELQKPIWSLEFQTGTFGGYGAPKKAMRMYAYLSLIYRAQMSCAWTWRSMLGGEEQYLYGLLDHDGHRGWKYDEFRQIAEDFKVLGQYGFPRKTTPKVAIAYSFESQKVMEANPSYYKSKYVEQVLQVYETLFDDNVDCNIINLRDVRMDYSIIVVAAHAVMDESSAETLREFIANGGVVVMTAYSAKVNENSQVFDIPMPGRLHDVFGIRAGEFNRAKSHTPIENEGGVEKTELNVVRDRPGIVYKGHKYELDIDYYEIVQANEAEVIAELTNLEETIPAITKNNYGKGQAIYVTVPADKHILKPLLNDLFSSLGLERGLDTPQGVVGRELDDKSRFYVNTSGREQVINLESKGWKGVLTGQVNREVLKLGAFEAELIVRD